MQARPQAHQAEMVLRIPVYLLKDENSMHHLSTYVQRCSPSHILGRLAAVSHGITASAAARLLTAWPKPIHHVQVALHKAWLLIDLNLEPLLL